MRGFKSFPLFPKGSLRKKENCVGAQAFQPAPVMAKFIIFYKQHFGERFYLKSIAFTMSIIY